MQSRFRIPSWLLLPAVFLLTAAILTADMIATEWFFKDGNALTVEEIRNWMVSTLQPIFGGQNKTLIFEGYNWYIRKR